MSWWTVDTSHIPGMYIYKFSDSYFAKDTFLKSYFYPPNPKYPFPFPLFYFSSFFLSFLIMFSPQTNQNQYFVHHPPPPPREKKYAPDI